jgi:hypothetical protein
MANNQTCPPIPTLDELLNSGNFIEVNINNLEVGETVIKYDPVVLDQNYQIRCVEILINSPEDVPNDEFGFRYASDPEVGIVRTSWKRWIGNTRFFRKINHRKNFDEFTTETEERIRNYPEKQQLTSAETIFANKDLSDNIGNFLGPSTSGKGGRRKRRGTRRTRTRKNKRKSTRRIGRKYKR